MSRSKDSTPNEHEKVGIDNFNNENYSTDNKYGQDLSGITYKKGISDHFGGDGSIGGNDVKRMMDAGYSSDDIYNFSKKKGLNYNQHGREYLQKEGDYKIGKGSDQWGDIFGSKETEQAVKEKTPVTPESQEKAQVFKDNKMEIVKQFMKKETPTFKGTDKGLGNLNVSQTSSFDRVFGNNRNSIGDGNTFGGNLNQGNQDYSLNLSGQSVYG